MNFVGAAYDVVGGVAVDIQRIAEAAEPGKWRARGRRRAASRADHAVHAPPHGLGDDL
jgi:hypothetical protein